MPAASRCAHAAPAAVSARWPARPRRGPPSAGGPGRRPARRASRSTAPVASRQRTTIGRRPSGSLQGSARSTSGETTTVAARPCSRAARASLGSRTWMRAMRSGRCRHLLEQAAEWWRERTIPHHQHHVPLRGQIEELPGKAAIEGHGVDGQVSRARLHLGPVAIGRDHGRRPRQGPGGIRHEIGQSDAAGVHPHRALQLLGDQAGLLTVALDHRHRHPAQRGSRSRSGGRRPARRERPPGPWPPPATGSPPGAARRPRPLLPGPPPFERKVPLPGRSRSRPSSARSGRPGAPVLRFIPVRSARRRTEGTRSPDGGSPGGGR
jgi:hypothetical protein